MVFSAAAYTVTGIKAKAVVHRKTSSFSATYVPLSFWLSNSKRTRTRSYKDSLLSDLEATAASTVMARLDNRAAHARDVSTARAESPAT